VPSVRPLTELIETQDPAWPEIEAAVATGSCPVVVLPADAKRADEELFRLQVTTRSWLGAVVHHTGGLVLDHGWLRVLGSGNVVQHMASLGQLSEDTVGGFLVAQDVLGGQFAWVAPTGGTPTIHYFAPDTLRWEDCERGYGDWLAAMIGGGMSGFYETLRWQGWAEEVAACRLDQAINVLPPLWTQEGKDINAASRRPIPMSEMMSLIAR
jgi:hypothetical protein